jgi:chemotaxis signal transduction protein
MSDSASNAETPEWLPPTAALTRFQLNDPKLDVSGPMELKQARYGVRVGGLRILLPGETVSEVVDSPKVFPIPNTISWFEGFINLRGNLVPVFDLRELFETTVAPGQRQMVLIIDKGANAVGIAIDGLPLPAPDRPPLDEWPPLPKALGNFTRSVFQHDQVLWLEVDIPGLVTSLAKEISA